MVRSLLHLNAVSEEDGQQVPVTTVFFGIFSATCSVVMHKSFSAFWLTLCDFWHEFNILRAGIVLAQLDLSFMLKEAFSDKQL